MKLKKLLTLGISLAIAMGAVACTNRQEAPNQSKPEAPNEQEKVTLDNEYMEKYSKYYTEYSDTLKNYELYSSPEKLTEYYKTNKYPGNEQHLENVKAIYKDGRDKIQSFIDSLKSDIKTEDPDLNKMKDDLIAEGEKTIVNIDQKLKNLDAIPKESMTKSQDEFIKLVNEATTLKDEAENNFTKMLEDMNNKLNIKPNGTNE